MESKAGVFFFRGSGAQRITESKKSRPWNFRLRHLWALEKNPTKNKCEVLLMGFLVTRRSRWWREGLDFRCRIVKVFWDQVDTAAFLYTQNDSQFFQIHQMFLLRKNMDFSILLIHDCIFPSQLFPYTSTLHGSATWIQWPNKIPWKPDRCINSPQVGMIKFLRKIPSSQLTWQWKFTFSNRKYIFKWWISHCYVSLPEGVDFVNTYLFQMLFLDF